MDFPTKKIQKTRISVKTEKVTCLDHIFTSLAVEPVNHAAVSERLHTNYQFSCTRPPSKKWITKRTQYVTCFLKDISSFATLEMCTGLANLHAQEGSEMVDFSQKR